MASLFGKNKLREVAQKIQTEEVQPYIEIVREWHNDYYHGSLRTDKETSREQQYNRDFFLTILGYREKPASPFSFEPKATTDKGQLPDAVISHTDKANDIANIAAVVELKGAGIDLDRPQRREGNFSPVQQGFKYKTQYRSVPFVIVSNFWEFRLYHDNLLDYEVWTLDDLVNPADDYLLFKTWYVLLNKDNFITPKGASKTEAILSDIRIEQENIGKKFYKVYREARVGLLRDIIEQNQIKHKELDVAIEKAQKIIDRIVFTAFAEDRGLLPDDTLQRIIRVADNSELGISLWDTLKSVFNAIDHGSDKLDIPNGYNGGLFKNDDMLNNLHISDGVLRKVVELGTYNFSEDLSVNILGHIFEQSISDIEEIKNKVNESQNLETLTQSRRKKDGIFYTPDYIVRYIVDNSLGTYLRDHEEKFKDEFGLKGDITDKTYEKREKQAYAKYQEFLQNVKVVDPACGSGAFLVYVFDYLLAENKRVGDILGNTLFNTDEYIRDILRNNIYGVDLNEESVEITKLSLWLKTAQKGKKLTALDDNIKCGNSLIDGPEIAGDKAFDWQERFADVFADGGFDVVVGNPPYLNMTVNNTDSSWLSFYNKRYQSIKKASSKNLFTLFNELATKLVKERGVLSFIIPEGFLKTRSYADNVELMRSRGTIKIAVYFENFVFSDATTGSVIFVYKHGDNSNETKNYIMRGPNHTFEELSINNPAIDRYNSVNAQPLSEIAVLFKGMVVADRSNAISTDKSFGNDRFILGKNIDRNLVESYFYTTYDSLKIVGGTKAKTKHDTAPRIVIRRTGNTLCCALLERSALTESTLYSAIINNKHSFDIDYYSLLAMLNSKFLSYVIGQVMTTNAQAFPQILMTDLQTLKIVIPKEHKNDLSALGRSGTRIQKELYEKSSRFVKLIMTEFGVEKWPTKLNKWWTLDFSDFVKTLKLNLLLTQKDDLLRLFEKYRTELSALDTQVQSTDRQIDQLVYQLYNLTLEEIAIVEMDA